MTQLCTETALNALLEQENDALVEFTMEALGFKFRNLRPHEIRVVEWRNQN